MKKYFLGVIFFGLLITSSSFAADGDLIVNGKVGIGTTSPAQNLSVTGNGYFSGNVGIGITPYNNYGAFASIANTNTNSQAALRGDSYVTTTTDGSYYNFGGRFFGRDNVNAGITNSGYIMGIETSSYLTGPGNINLTYGAKIDTGTFPGTGTGTVSSAYGVYVRLLNQGSGTITNGFGILVGSNKYSGTIGTAYGVYIANMDATNGYGVYQLGTDDINYFAGNTGIGTNAPGSYKLYVNGTMYATTYAGSDLRWKKNIVPISNAMSLVEALQGVSFEWRKDEFKDKNFEEGRQIGLIAQDVEQVIPEIVKTDKDGYKAIAYEKLTAVLVEALKEQQQRIRELTVRIEELEKK